jgi:aerobic carbon-monoxide dehydrogenase medium subunit
MKPAAFTYHAPQTLGDALALLATHGDAARALAGGQSLVPMMNTRIARPEHVVDINALRELNFIRETPDTVELGALVRHCDIERSPLLQRVCPLLPAVAATIGHLAIRERGTIGGSLAHADPAAQWPMVAMLLNARIDLATSSGRRSIAARDFFAGVFTTAAETGELLTSVAFPRLAAREGVAYPRLGTREGWGYRAFTRRHGDYAVVAVAVTLKLDTDGTIDRLRLALGGVGGVPVSLHAIAAGWTGRILDAGAIREIAKQAAASVEPADDVQASAEFRRELIEVLTADALADALGRTGG